MACDAVICDWNGTISADRDEKSLLSCVAVDVFKRCLPFHPFKLMAILKVKWDLDELYRQKRQDQSFDFVTTMYQLYNERVVMGCPSSLIKKSVESYAWRSGIKKLDRRILRIVQEWHGRGKLTGLLSGAYEHGIRSVLGAAGFGDIFDICCANTLKEHDGVAIGFDLNVYRNKVQLLDEILAKHRIDRSRTVYVGDSDVDAGCFEYVGYPVVSLLAPDDVKKAYASRYNAFVPHSEADLKEYLRSLAV